MYSRGEPGFKAPSDGWGGPVKAEPAPSAERAPGGSYGEMGPRVQRRSQGEPELSTAGVVADTLRLKVALDEGLPLEAVPLSEPLADYESSQGLLEVLQEHGLSELMQAAAEAYPTLPPPPGRAAAAPAHSSFLTARKRRAETPAALEAGASHAALAWLRRAAQSPARAGAPGFETSTTLSRRCGLAVSSDACAWAGLWIDLS